MVGYSSSTIPSRVHLADRWALSIGIERIGQINVDFWLSLSASKTTRMCLEGFFDLHFSVVVEFVPRLEFRREFKTVSEGVVFDTAAISFD